MSHRTSLLLCTFAFLGLAVTATADAHAGSWAVTLPANGNCGNGVFNAAHSSGFGVDNTGNTWDEMLYCSVPSITGLLDATKLYGAQAIVYDGHTGDFMQANLCALNPTTGTISCGSSSRTSTGGVGTYALWVWPPSGGMLSYYGIEMYFWMPERQYSTSSVRSYNVWKK